MAPDTVMVSDDLTVEKGLTGAPGDAAGGREAFANRKQGNCLACHVENHIARKRSVELEDNRSVIVRRG